MSADAPAFLPFRRDPPAEVQAAADELARRALGPGPGGGGRGRGRGRRKASGLTRGGAGEAQTPRERADEATTSAGSPPPPPPALAVASRGKKEAHGGGDDAKPQKPKARAGRGGRAGRGAGNASAANDSGATTAKLRHWWQSLPEDVVDCVTFESIRDLKYPPFELQPAESTTGGSAPRAAKPDEASNYLFDPKTLSRWWLTTTQFIHPFSRRPVTLAEVKRLDKHLDRHNLRDPEDPKRLADAFARPEERLRELLIRDTTRERGVINDELMRVLYRDGSENEDPRRAQAFGPPMRGNRAGGRGGRGRERVHVRTPDDALLANGPQQLGADSGWRMIDDGMQGEWATLGVPVPPAQMLRHASAFPSLGQPSVAPPPEAFPALGPAPGASRTSTWGGTAAAGPPASVVAAASRPAPPPPPPRPARAAPVSTASAPATSAETDSAESSEDAAAIARRRQLADAFGVANPESRPSSFAASSAARFSADVLALARREPNLVRTIEEQLDKFLSRCSTMPRRHSLPPFASKLHRKLCHEVAESYGLTTCSFGGEPNRHVDCFYAPGAPAPSARLSDALLVDPSVLDAAVVQARDEGTHRMTFFDVENIRSLRNMLREWDVALDRVAGSEDRYIALFASAAALAQARDRFGAGVRGLFRVEPDAKPAPTTEATSANAVEASAAISPRVDDAAAAAL